MKVKNKLIAILLSASLVSSLMPALAFAAAGDEDAAYGAAINVEHVEESQLAEPVTDSMNKQEAAIEIESNAIEAKSSEWQQTGNGTQYYAEFPSGYNMSSSLYSKYNRSKLTSYENTTNKRVVNTTRVSYIYWHWTWNASVSTEQNNKLIDDKQGYDGEHDYQYFTDFESSEEYPVWSGDSRVYEYWRNRPEDGSKWWFRIPVYKQTYTDYKLVQPGGTTPATNPSSTVVSGGNPVTSKAPKAVSLGKCKSGKRQCTVKWKKSKKCSGYIVRYSTDPNFTVCRTKVIKGKNKTSCTLKKLAGGTVYYIQVCCYRESGGTRICSAWSKCRKVKIKASKKAKGAKAGDIGLNFSTPDGHYYNGIKVGNYFYCGVKNKIVRVNLKTKKKKTVTTNGLAYCGAGSMCIRNGYLYYFAHDGEDYSYGSLVRVRVDGKEKSVFWDDYANDLNRHYTKLLAYEIVGDRVRFLVESEVVPHYVLYVAHLDSLDLRIENSGDHVGIYSFNESTHGNTNAKGYKIYEKGVRTKGGVSKRYIWLKTPKWKLNLGREY